MTDPAAPETDLADGRWHRLHPATPVLKGGIGLLVVIGFVVSNLRERLVELVVPAERGYSDGDPIDEILDRGLVGWAVLVVVVGLAVAVFAFWLSWRMHSFRITDEVVEVRSGLLFRTNRRARLDRVQGVTVQRPVLARLFGAAKLDVSVAGQDATVQLSYLGSGLADLLRRDILRLATGVRMREAGVDPEAAALDAAALDPAVAAGDGPVSGGDPARTTFLARRIDELGDEFAAERPAPSAVTIPAGRLLGSLVLSGFTLFLLVAIAATVFAAVQGSPVVLFAILPGVIGSGGYYVRRFVRSLRYSISGSPDGVRIGYGVLSTSSDTLPPGRIHAVEVRQPLLWRPFGWWEVRIDRAGRASAQGANGDPGTTVLPVGDLAAVQRVLALLLPGGLAEELPVLIDDALRRREAAGFSSAPRRAAWLRPFSWRRTGYLLHADAVLLRSGAVWRHLAIVPTARIQSIGIQQGPLQRLLDVASARVHTVSGPVVASVPVLARTDAVALFEAVARAAVTAAEADTSERPRASVASVPVPSPPLRSPLPFDPAAAPPPTGSPDPLHDPPTPSGRHRA